MAKKDYYDSLGVPRGASDEEIKKGYRRLAHQYHPDKTGGDEAKFKEINEAYQVLSSKEKRAQYDQFGTTFEGVGPGGFGGFDFSQGFGGLDQFDLGDMFGDFFGTRARKRGRARERGQNIAVDVEIALEDAANGAERTFELKKLDRCSRCGGNGAEPGTAIKPCPACHGSGYVREARRTFLGTFSTETVCVKCGGEGKTPEKSCADCRGEGRVSEIKEITLRIPQGIRDGEIIKITGEGEAGPYGRDAGDLYATIHIKAHPYFTRDEDDIRYVKEVSFADAALGATVPVPTLEGTVRMEIPVGIDSGKVLRLRGKGMPRLHGRGRGDILVTIQVATPKKLSKRARELLEELGKELS